MNLIEGRISRVEGETAWVDWGQRDMDLAGPMTGTLAKGDEATFAIRPEKIRISREEPHDRDNRVQGEILDIAYLGNLSTYHVKLPDGRVIKSEMINASRIERRDFTWEETVWLSWTASAGLVLPE